MWMFFDDTVIKLNQMFMACVGLVLVAKTRNFISFSYSTTA